ncbi:MAG: hypothetical protein AB1490_24890 [Pseudomonadota bacterium]
MQLGFDELDDLAFSAALQVNAADSLFQIAPGKLGPLIEFEWLRFAGLSIPSLDNLSNSQRRHLIRLVLSGRKNAIFENGQTRSRVIRCHWLKDEEPDDWYFFCKSMQEAASITGFPRKNAEELVAGVRELVSNIYDHSEASDTGLAAYAVIDNELELVIADRGIGVLESLRSSPEFKTLRDDGEALQAALTDGTSRYGHASGHGGGFRDLFHGLLNLSSSLRFRSGDHALTIDGISPGLSKARISQKTKLPGFVISIACLR